MTATADLMPEAFSVVLGCAGAQMNGQPADVNLLLSGFREDAKAKGYTDDVAWGVLFAAATGWVSALVECRAAHHKQTPGKVIQDLAANLIGDPT